MTHDQERFAFEKLVIAFEGSVREHCAAMIQEEPAGIIAHWAKCRDADRANLLAWQAAKREPVGEAVAWMVQGKQCGEPATFLYYKDEWPKAHAEHGDKVTPLFTHPPEAMAVTDEMVERACIAAAAYAKLVDKNADAWNEYSEDEKANCRSLFRAAIKAMATTPRGG